MRGNQSTGFAGEIGKLRMLMERVLHEVQATNEGVGAMREELAQVPKRDEFNQLADKIEIIQKAVTATNRDVTDLDHRVTRLEAAR